MMRIELGNDITELATAMAALERFSLDLALDQSAREAAELVLDELLSNIIRHGGPGGCPGKIILELAVENDCLSIRISDGGVAFNPFDRAPPDLGLSIEEREPGGLGIHLVKQFMDEYSYRYADQRNIVLLKKKLAPAPDMAPAPAKCK